MRQNPSLDSKEYQDFDPFHANGVLTVRVGGVMARSGLQGVEFHFLLKDQ